MKNMLDVTSKAANDFTKSDVWNKIFDEMHNAIQEATNTIRGAARNDDKVVLVIRKYVTTLNLIVGSLREVFKKNREVCGILADISEYTKDTIEHTMHLLNTDYGDKGSDTTFVL
jgi:hypothetical protein